MRYMWHRSLGHGVCLGLTEDALKEMGVCWTFVPTIREGQQVSIGQTIATIQTSARLTRIKSPVEGVVTEISEHALVRPEELTSGETLFVIGAEHAMLSV